MASCRVVKLPEYSNQAAQLLQLDNSTTQQLDNNLQHCPCQPTHSSPSGLRSFFQIGTLFLISSIAVRQASKASARWGEEQAMAIEVSPTTRCPRRWTTATRTWGR